MKKIILFRHGKSDWAATHETDHDRVLARRGVKAAKAMGSWLTGIGQQPDYLASSTAVRAYTSIELARDAGQWNLDIHAVPQLYDSSVEAYLAVIRETPDTVETLLVAGHEPTCSMTSSRLIDGGLIRFPTAAMMRIDVDVERWREVEGGAGTLIWFMIPQALP